MSKNKINKISTTVYQIDLGVVNCFIIEDLNGLTLIDTGFKGDDVKIFKALTNINKKPSDIKQIILTHLHADHSGAASDIQKKLKIPVYCSAIDGKLLSQGISLRENTKTTKGLLNKVLKMIFVKSIQQIDPIEKITYLKNFQLLPFGNGMEVHFTPGHSDGHISILIKKDSLLISGDICANNIDLTLSIVNEDLEKSIKTLKQLKTIEFAKASFGHGRPILDNAKIKLLNKFSK